MMFSADLILVGFGHVAQRFVRLLEERARELREIHRLDWRVVGIATRRHGLAGNLRGLDLSRLMLRGEARQSFR